MQICTYQKERVQNAVLFFVERTKNVGITKLCKLLYFADIDNYIQRGASITGLEYNARERGPVPHDVYIELQKDIPQRYRKYNLKNFIAREHPRSQKAGSDECFFTIKKNKRFDSEYFTLNELDIMNTVAEKYRDTLGTEMSEESHMPGKPWEQTWADGAGEGLPIDFDLDLGLNSNTDNIERIKNIKNRISVTQEALKAL